MPTFECTECGHTVHSPGDYPIYNTPWSDGHRCRFRKVENVANVAKSPAPEPKPADPTVEKVMLDLGWKVEPMGGGTSAFSKVYQEWSANTPEADLIFLITIENDCEIPKRWDDPVSVGIYVCAPFDWELLDDTRITHFHSLRMAVLYMEHVDPEDYIISR